MEIIVALGLVLLAGLGIAAVFFSWQNYKNGQKAAAQEQSLALMQQQIGQLTSNVNQRLEAVSRDLLNSQKTVGDRLDNAARVVGDVQRSLGTLSQASERIFEVGKDIAGLQQILSAPKLRGGLGEYFLGDLLEQILPARHFKLQHGFRGGRLVDAVIQVGERLVPVDAKFPLENFRRVVEAASDEERRSLKKKFVSDVKKHIDAIAEKYILPDEGTFDFALMYIPAENVYYEIIIKDDASEDKSLAAYALEQKVIPVSPNCFYAYLQAILLGLRGFEIEESARTILQNLSRLQGDFNRFREDFEVLGGHIGKTQGKYADTEKRMARIQDKLLSLSEEKPELTVEGAEPRLLSER